MRSIVFSATKTFQNHFVFYFFVTKRLQFKSLNNFFWGGGGILILFFHETESNSWDKAADNLFRMEYIVVVFVFVFSFSLYHI